MHEHNMITIILLFLRFLYLKWLKWNLITLYFIKYIVIVRCTHLKNIKIEKRQVDIPTLIFVLEENEVALFTDIEDYMDKDVEDDGLVLAFPDIQKR